MEAWNIYLSIPLCNNPERALELMQKVLFHRHNQTFVDIWKTGTTKSADTMALVRLLYFCAAKYNVNVIITYIAGVNNAIADALSRFPVTHFRQLAPLPDIIPAWPAQFLKDCSVAINH